MNGKFLTQIELHGEWWSTGPAKIKTLLWFLQIKKNYLNLIKKTEYSRFIVLESLEKTCLAKLLSFVIEKIISCRVTPQNVKKLRNGYLYVKVNNYKQTKNFIKLKTFHNVKCKAYPHDRLKISKGVIRSRKLSLLTRGNKNSLRKTMGHEL